jgi:hypothetical protein
LSDSNKLDKDLIGAISFFDTNKWDFRDNVMKDASIEDA